MTTKTHAELLEDIQVAEANYNVACEAWDRYSGNNPEPPAFKRYRAAAEELQRAKEAGKAAGAIPRTAEELLWLELDAAFPNARSNQVVEHAGRRCQRKFVPTGDKYRPWDRYWKELPGPIDPTDA